jgi:hypothetical protein
MGSIFAVLAGVVKQIEEKPDNSFGYGVVATIFCFLYFGVFTTGFQATGKALLNHPKLFDFFFLDTHSHVVLLTRRLVWVYPPEILPVRIRAKGTALATACNWLINVQNPAFSLRFI